MIPRPYSYDTLKKSPIYHIKDLKIENEKTDNLSLSLFLKRTELNIKEDSNITLFFKKSNQPDLNRYEIDFIDNIITITYASLSSQNYALVTLYLLLRENDYKIRNFKLIDFPKYERRGIHLDSARHFIEINCLYKIIDEMSLLKLNILHFHLSDDQGFSIESKVFPKLNQLGTPYYTQEEIISLVSYAKERYITIVPEIDMPGHTTSILSAYNELSCDNEKVTLGKLPGIYSTVFCVSKGSVYTFIDDLLSEIIPLFDSPYFHIGGDEVPVTQYHNCPSCMSLYEKENLKSMSELTTFFLKSVIKILKEKGKSAIIYNDSYNSILDTEDLIIQYWNQGSSEKEIKKYNKQKRPFISSDYFHFYYDYPTALSNLKRSYKYKSKFKNLLGYESCLWSENITTSSKLEEMLFPRIYALSEINWVLKRNYKKFLNNVETHIKFTKGIEIPKKETWNPKGKLLRESRYSFYFNMVNTKTNNISLSHKTPIKVVLKYFIYYLGFSGLRMINKIKREGKNK